MFLSFGKVYISTDMYWSEYVLFKIIINFFIAKVSFFLLQFEYNSMQDLKCALCLQNGI